MAARATSDADSGSIPNSTLAGADLYDALYASGAYSMRNVSRAGDLLGELKKLKVSHGLRSVLDVGCSHGFVVTSELWPEGYKASGVDVSAVAIKRAHELHGEPKDRCMPPCFATASVSATIPWANRTFDAVISSDVLEHLRHAEVDGAVQEIARVTSKVILLKIPVRADWVDAKQIQQVDAMQVTANLASRANATGHGHITGKLPANLHDTIKPPSFWIAKFVGLNDGWRLLHHLPTPRGRPWLCCSFVLERRGSISNASRVVG